ncbi:MAG: NADH-quinone oxidoreductase subunit H [Cellulomonas sp.]|nr:NADH-quinone oxidoreductase subunit H [Cellulomonas sp.]
MVISPLLVGLIRQVRARIEGRRGAGILQPWRDLRKLLGKDPVRAADSGWVLRVAPVALVVSSLLLCVLLPLVGTLALDFLPSDLFVIVSVMLIGVVALALVGLDGGTAFGGMGSSREITIAALVEPTILLAVFALSIPGQSANLSAIVSATLDDPGQVLSLGSVLAFVALVIVIIAETGRLPVDNPSTHLELTMIHEAMVLEYSGPKLALIEWASGMRLTVLLAMLANLFLPWGIAGADPSLLAVLLGAVAIAVKVAVLAGALAAAEVFIAKLRYFRVPELLAGSFLLALLAVTASYFLATPTQ